MTLNDLGLGGALTITPKRWVDARGYFTETWSRARFVEAGLDVDWVQDNHSYSEAAWTLRGLHYQAPPFDQDKLVYAVAGEVFDVVVDLRQGSPSFGRWAGARLSAANGTQMFAPKGFAHGFLTLTPDAHVVYKVSAPYSAAHDRAIRFDDPDLGVVWPLGGQAPILSEKDAAAALLREYDPGFRL